MELVLSGTMLRVMLHLTPTSILQLAQPTQLQPGITAKHQSDTDGDIQNNATEDTDGQTIIQHAFL